MQVDKPGCLVYMCESLATCNRAMVRLGNQIQSSRAMVESFRLLDATLLYQRPTLLYLTILYSSKALYVYFILLEFTLPWLYITLLHCTMGLLHSTSVHPTC